MNGIKRVLFVTLSLLLMLTSVSLHVLAYGGVADKNIQFVKDGVVLESVSAKANDLITSFPQINVENNQTVVWFYKDTNVVVTVPYTVCDNAIMEARIFDKSFSKVVAMQYTEINAVTNTQSVRFVSVLQSLDGSETGFEVIARYIENGVLQEKHGVIKTTHVYSKINATENGSVISVSATELGGLYVSALAIEDVPTNVGRIDFYVKSYVVVKGETVYSEQAVAALHNGAASPSTPDVEIAANKRVNFKIVYPADTTNDVIESINTLSDTLVACSSGGSVSILDSDNNGYNANATEILIGDTGYPESKQVMSRIGYGDWVVRFEGKKLVIAGYSRDAICRAITQAVQTLEKCSDGMGNITVAGDLWLVGTSDAIINNLPRYESASSHLPVTADEGQNASLAVMRRSTIGEYEAYLSKLANQGYTLYTSNTIGENRFATYTNNDYLIHAGWYSNENSARITIEEKYALAGLESDNVWNPIDGITTSLAQFGMTNGVKEGMGYCYQLADGSFIVIDGGNPNDAFPLYDYMKAKAPNGEIVIAAWFITHNDPDHYRAFVKFVNTYKDQFKIEAVIKNTPNSSAYAESGSTVNHDAHELATVLPGCKVIKAHTGQKIYIRNAVVEMLYTIDNYLPSPLKIFNNSSMVFSVDVEGERAIFTGDISDEAAGLLLSMYSNSLKCDILQLAHHGLRNGHGLNMPNMIELYKVMRPEVVLWPSSESHYLNVDNEDESQQVALHSWNLEGMKSARETWIAGNDRITVFELPYSFFSAYRFDPSDPHPPSVAKEEVSDSESLIYCEVADDALIGHVGWADGSLSCHEDADDMLIEHIGWADGD